MYSYRELLSEGEKRLNAAGIREAKVDAWLLFAGTTGMTRTSFLMRDREEAPEAAAGRFFEKIGRRALREPVQYIQGTAPFMGYDFLVNENVLIPRMDTEVLAEEAVNLAKRFCIDRPRKTAIDVLDMCTGSGCIIESLYKLLMEQGFMIHGAASDISPEALWVARENAKRLGADIEFFQGDLFENVTGKYELILSNPPYIRSGVIAGLEPEVKDHEPLLALDGMEDGLHFYRRIIAGAGEYLEEGGYLLLEIGYDQGLEVSRLLKAAGYEEVRIIKDLAGLDRVAEARKKRD